MTSYGSNLKIIIKERTIKLKGETDMAIGKMKLPVYYEVPKKRINAKSKRRKNIMKKAIELRRMCGVEVLIIIKDKEYRKVSIYNSSDQVFPPEIVNKIVLQNYQNNAKEPKFKFYQDKDYPKLIADRDLEIEDSDDQPKSLSQQLPKVAKEQKPIKSNVKKVSTTVKKSVEK